jgi:hypothetical protein
MSAGQASLTRRSHWHIDRQHRRNFTSRILHSHCLNALLPTAYEFYVFVKSIYRPALQTSYPCLLSGIAPQRRAAEARIRPQGEISSATATVISCPKSGPWRIWHGLSDITRSKYLLQSTGILQTRSSIPNRSERLLVKPVVSQASAGNQTEARIGPLAGC